jgi:hypothetical protein
MPFARTRPRLRIRATIIFHNYPASLISNFLELLKQKEIPPKNPPTDSKLQLSVPKDAKF